MTDLHYNIKWTIGVWSITVLALIAMIFSLYAIIFGSRIDWWYFKLPVAVIIVTAIAVCFYMAPISLKLTENQLTIKRGGKAVLIPYNQIEEVGLFSFKPTTVRVIGSGGFFGYTGKFSNNELGIFTACIGDTSHTFYIKTKGGKKYGLSCEQPALVVTQLREKTGL